MDSSLKGDLSADKETLRATKNMCHNCFDVLMLELGHQSIAKADFTDDLPDKNIRSPLFVTWEKRRGTKYQLRGCIGSLSPVTLASAVSTYAVTSAVRDRRFHPIESKEVPLLRVSVSILVDYEPCKDCFDWVVGKHGILIEWFEESQYSATFLPEVAKDQGWDVQTTVHHLVRKAGYRGTLKEELLSTIKCTRYQSSKQNLTFEEYSECKQGRGTSIDDFEFDNDKKNNTCSIM